MTEDDAPISFVHEEGREYEIIAVLPLLTALDQLGYHLEPGMEVAIQFRRPNGITLLIRRENPLYISPSPMATRSSKRKEKPGYIYLVQGDGDLYKIGRTKQPTQRLYHYGETLPFPIQIISHYHVPDMQVGETYWHDRFASKRINGEWFRLDEGDVQAFIAAAQEQAI